MTDIPTDFQDAMLALESSYLQSDDPIRQSGFGGGAERWRNEREPILDAVHADGDLLDIGCANGYLLECLVDWARERGRALTPHGVDIGEKLVDLARRRLPLYTGNLHVGDAWTWQPPRKYAYVYSVCDIVPPDHRAEYAQRLLRSCVEPGGRLILGSYGSHSRQTPPVDVAALLRSAGLPVAGTAEAGDGPLVRFAWVDA